jgi:23S rRNA pseudouridine955/2504/2580 synthase
MNKWTVSEEDSGLKLQSFLTKHLKTERSQKALKKLIENNSCTVNGRVERFASYNVFKGDVVVFHDTTLSQSSHLFDKKRVLYEDASLLIYNKPDGIISDEDGLPKVLSEYVGTPVFPVHRLDRVTTGAILFAKNERIRDRLIEEFRTRDVKKVYLAIVDGLPKEDRGAIENYLGKLTEKGGSVYFGAVPKTKGKYAKTEWRVLKRGQKAALVECSIITGRTHQIRIHMADIGHPILGDPRYGQRFTCSYHPPRCLLHAYKLEFKHPVTENLVSIEAEIPMDFSEALKTLNLKR